MRKRKFSISFLFGGWSISDITKWIFLINLKPPQSSSFCRFCRLVSKEQFTIIELSKAARSFDWTVFTIRGGRMNVVYNWRWEIIVLSRSRWMQWGAAKQVWELSKGLHIAHFSFDDEGKYLTGANAKGLLTFFHGHRDLPRSTKPLSVS